MHPPDDAEALRATLDKLKRRQARNQRAAFARGLMQGVLSMLKPGDVVFDCGANVGDVTEPLAMTGATVHAFEPDPYAFARLSRRMAGRANVILHDAAVGVTAGRAALMRATAFEDNPAAGSVRSTLVAGGRRIDTRPGTAIDVEVLSLPDMIRAAASRAGEVAVLKMDIEGAELAILEHMRAERLFDLVRLTVAETHEGKFRALRPRFAALRAALAAEHPVTRVNLDWI
ncbi:FkbM family methyltransferase [Roseibacterium sp. SDUM158017]|uniref:FkbM family methyltransferase n=1 Tax=Roseicyclus salinarum TaxID=3036773 RepID=UPI0024151AA3|nr:FkbM family methyltransferase [Roseibacterium sp. SDUM158017]MDG4647662.1 FkbM family methyltransferase [Roseibacterium sp. SDUM158017]